MSDMADPANLEHDSLEDAKVKPKSVKRAPNKAILKPKGTKWPWGDEWLHPENDAIFEGQLDED